VVSDNGPGIAPEHQSNIFDFSFSGSGRAESGSRSPSPARLGFGLWWVKTLMARLGGAIGVESDGHSGATFRLRLPAASETSRSKIPDRGGSREP
jgi:signal transduction histidine kinase